MSRDRELDRKLESVALRKLAYYVFSIVIISVLLLAINAGMVFGLATAIETQLATVPGIEAMMQYFIYIMPIILLFLEWYAWDVLTSIRRHRRI